MSKEAQIKQLKLQVKTISAAIKKHRGFAMWGNVESKQRIKELQETKKEILKELEVLNKC